MIYSGAGVVAGFAGSGSKSGCLMEVGAVSFVGVDDIELGDGVEAGISKLELMLVGEFDVTDVRGEIVVADMVDIDRWRSKVMVMRSFILSASGDPRDTGNL